MPGQMFVDLSLRLQCLPLKEVLAFKRHPYRVSVSTLLLQRCS